MRAREFVKEGKGAEKFTASSRAALPNAEYWPDLDNSTPYHAFRFSVAMAGEPKEHMSKEGPTHGQKLVTVGYSKAEREIIAATAKSMGYKGKPLSTDGSEETDDTNVVSPVANWMNKK